MAFENDHHCEGLHQSLLERMPVGFSYNRIILDENGNPLDFIYEDINDAFQQQTGFSKEMIIGRKASEIIPGLRHRKTDWVAIGGKAALEGAQSSFEYYSEIHNKWFTAFVYGVQPGYFAILLHDITDYRVNQQSLRKILDFSPDYMVITDLMGTILDCNNMTVAVFGDQTKDSLIGTSAMNLIAPIHRSIIREDMLAALQTGSFNNNLYTFSTAAGIEFPGEMSVSLIHDDSRKPIGYVAIAKDVSDRLKTQNALRASEEKLRSVFSSSPDSIIVTDLFGMIQSCNQAACSLLGYTNIEHLKGICLFDFIDPSEMEKLAQRRKMLNEQGTIKNAEYLLNTYDGRTIIAEVSSSIIRNASGQTDNVVIIAKDISDRKKSELEIKYLSYHDKLTGLYNRVFFDEELGRLDSHNQLPLSVIIGDLNGLKLTNDIFGHSEGDRLLQRMAKILLQASRQEDIAVRWGGDEFALILPLTPNHVADEICKKIIELCSETDQDLIRPSIALGFATKEKPYQNIQQVIKEAENHMYRHKLLDSRSNRSSIIASLEKTLFERNYETDEHAQRMRRICSLLGKALGLSRSELDDLSLFALLHDIGKIAVSDRILMKPGKLTTEEWEEMKKHPEIGFRIAESTQELSHISEYILFHHERWDGTGYPHGLKAGAIPKLSRILAIVDAYDVMTHSRPYKDAVSKEDAIAEIRLCAGKQFDPEIAEVFIRVMNSSQPDK